MTRREQLAALREQWDGHTVEEREELVVLTALSVVTGMCDVEVAAVVFDWARESDIEAPEVSATDFDIDLDVEVG